MIFKLEKYNGTHRIVSLALDQDTYDNLLKEDLDFIAQFKKIVALGYLIQQKYRNDIRNMLP